MAHKIREVYIVHHSHTDVGYTDLQEQVIYNQVNNIRRAVELIEEGLEKGGTEESHFHVSSQMMRLARSRLIVASRRRFWIIRFVSFIGCLSCCSG